MSVVTQAAGLVAFPVAAAATGSVVAALRRPGPRVTSALQHLAAGVVLAAVAVEVLPDLRSEGHLPWVVVGFSVGVAVLLTLGAYSRRLERRIGERAGAAAGALPVGLLAAVGIDLLIDGVLVGLGATLGRTQAVLLTVALTLEILFLGLSVCVELLELGVARARAAGISAGLGLLTAVGAIGSAALLGDADARLLATVLAFGVAALLYLVVEELLVEAHEQSETVLLSVMFFVGFLGLYLLGGLEG